MADPEPSVGTDGGAGPVARDGHVAAAGELPPGIAVGVVGPQIVEEGCARLAGEDDEPHVVDPGGLVAKAGGRARSRRQLGPGIRGEVVGPQVAEDGRAVAAAEQEGRAAVAGHGPGVILACGGPGDIEARPGQRLRLGRAGGLDRLARRRRGRGGRCRGGGGALVRRTAEEGVALQAASTSASASAARAVIGTRIRASPALGPPAVGVRRGKGLPDRELVALGVAEEAVPALARDFALRLDDRSAELGSPLERCVDRVDVDVRAQLLGGALAALADRAAHSLLPDRRGEQVITLEAGDRIAEAPAEEA